MKNPSCFLFALPILPMTSRPSSSISSRRTPKQARSADLLEAILQAAVQVLAREGVSRFTTTRVAERAGVSVGSVYQYFPNKASILFRLQSDEWRQTTQMMRGILEDVQRPVLERLRLLTHAFVRSECDEAQVRTALGDAAPFYRDAPEAQQVRAAGDGIVKVFMRQALPAASDVTREMAGELIVRTLSTVGKDFSESPRTVAEIEAWAESMADMLCAYVERLASR